MVHPAPRHPYDACTVETTITAAEFCTAGIWERADGGYRMLNRCHDLSLNRAIWREAPEIMSTMSRSRLGSG